MTRLTRADLKPLPATLTDHDKTLVAATGHDLTGLALTAAGLPSEDAGRKALGRLKLAVVPMTGGLGRIEGFAACVSAILAHLGCAAFVTRGIDVAGLAEAVRGKPSAIFISDDDDFVALDGANGTAIHNTDATAQGFVTGLACMADGLAGKKVLLLGCGPLGRAAARCLMQYEARVVVYDPDTARCTGLRDQIQQLAGRRIEIGTSFHAAASDVDLFFDATNSADHIDVDVITDHTRLAAPGMPRGVTTAARRRLGHRLLHDPLQLGVATMAAQVLVARMKPASKKAKSDNG